MVSLEQEGDKFELGLVVITAGGKAALDEISVMKSLRRHHCGDWGDIGAEDASLNDLALSSEMGNRGRLVSMYHDSSKTKFYIVTEWDRSQTTVLLPEEY